MIYLNSESRKYLAEACLQPVRIFSLAPAIQDQSVDTGLTGPLDSIVAGVSDQDVAERRRIENDLTLRP